MALGIWAFDGEKSRLSMLQGMQPCSGLSPLPSLDYFPLQTGAGAMWQLGEQVLPCSQENISVWVESPASVGSCGWLCSLPAGRGGVPAQSLPSPPLRPGSAFHSLEKSSNYFLQPFYPKLPAQLRQWLL